MHTKRNRMLRVVRGILQNILFFNNIERYSFEFLSFEEFKFVKSLGLWRVMIMKHGLCLQF